MTWSAEHPDDYEGRVVGDGHCVPFVQAATGAPHTSTWRRGPQVRHSLMDSGTAIATFDPDGRYGNHRDGREIVTVSDRSRRSPGPDKSLVFGL